MTCPNCSHLMNYINLDYQHILHCGNCGASFFEENAINRISLNSVQKLSQDKKTDEISGSEKICPLDHAALRPIENSEAIPQNITLLRCETCHRIFAFPDDLLNFKQAQKAKIQYFKTWQKPLPALQTVIVMFLLIIVGGTVFYQLSPYLKQYLQPSVASDLIKNFQTAKSGHYLLIFFKTPTPFQSKIIIEDRTTGSTIEKIINQHPATIHQLTTGGLNLEDEIWYQVVLIDNQGKEIRTEFKALRLKF